MSTRPWGGVVRQLRRSVLLHDAASLTDGQLLESFVARRDEAAFEALVRRHGPMVLGVCRGVLRNAHDAEDAFQATFLVLVRKAASLRRREAVGNWLYGVAYRTALQARTTAARRRLKEAQMRSPESQDSAAAGVVRLELQALLDRELSRLPQKYQAPIVLCDLLGKTKREAAADLGCPEGTVSSRLARGRELLRRRLARQGLASAGSLALVPDAVQAV